MYGVTAAEKMARFDVDLLCLVGSTLRTSLRRRGITPASERLEQSAAVDAVTAVYMWEGESARWVIGALAHVDAIDKRRW
jgi:hypothetical protein